MRLKKNGLKVQTPINYKRLEVVQCNPDIFKKANNNIKIIDSKRY